MKDSDLPKGLGISRPKPKTHKTQRTWWKAFFGVGLLAVLGAALAPMVLPTVAPPGSTKAPREGQGSESALVQLPDLETQVAALGRLEPENGVVGLAVPRSSSDALVASVSVDAGAVVKKGDVIATMSTRSRTHAALETAEAEVRAQEIELRRVLLVLEQARADAEADVQVAAARRDEAVDILARQERLQASRKVSVAVLEEARKNLRIANAQHAQAETQLGQLPDNLTKHPDYTAAKQALTLSELHRNRASLDFDETSLRSPIDGMVIEVVAQPGERPGSGGIVRLADLSTMIVRMEVHQNRIHLVSIGDAVQVQGEALDTPLSGQVTAIGFEVLDQGIIGSDPVAANDARVFEVIARLDAPSAEAAARLINLQVIATIEVGT